MTLPLMAYKPLGGMAGLPLSLRSSWNLGERTLIFTESQTWAWYTAGSPTNVIPFDPHDKPLRGMLSLPILQMKKLRLRMGMTSSRFHDQQMVDLGLDCTLRGSKTVLCIMLALVGPTGRLVGGLHEPRTHSCTELSPSSSGCGTARPWDTKT